VSGFLAFLAATVAVIFASRAFRLQRKEVRALEAEKRELEKEKRAEFASRVAAWLEYDPEAETPVPHYTVKNDSGLPIYMVSLWVNTPSKERGHHTFIPVMPPGLRRYSFPDADTVPREATVGMLFGDPKHRSWLRSDFGDLFEVPSDAADNARISIPNRGRRKVDLYRILGGDVPPSPVVESEDASDAR
jgi:hypothetical protein